MMHEREPGIVAERYGDEREVGRDGRRERKPLGERRGDEDLIVGRAEHARKKLHDRRGVHDRQDRQPGGLQGTVTSPRKTRRAGPRIVAASVSRATDTRRLPPGRRTVVGSPKERL